MSSVNIEMLERAAEALDPLVATDVVFLGGATIALWATDVAPIEFRPTDDVDVIVEIASLGAYYELEERLREMGFVNDDEEGIICRFRHRASALVVDVMPTEVPLLGFESQWQKEAFPRAVAVELPSGQSIRAVPPSYLLAMKLERSDHAAKGTCTGATISRT